MRRLAVLGFLWGVACFNPVQETTRPFKEAARAREAGKWAGQYVFGECAGNGQCWRYEIAVTTDGDAFMTVIGDPKPLRMNLKPRVHQDALDMSFVSYADEGVDPSDVGFGVLDPLRGRFSPNQRLGTVTRGPSGSCFVFESLESKLGSKMVCTR